MKRILLIGVVILAFAMSVVGAAVPEEYVEEVGVEDAAGLFIHNVPDASQPPSNTLHFHSVDNWCAPIAASNSIVFLDSVVGLDWAHGVTGDLDPLELSEYLGYFMTTNGEGDPRRENEQQCVPGTLSEDIGPGIVDFAVWDGREALDVPPLEKQQVKWRAVHLDQQVDDALFFTLLVEFIRQTGVPPVLCFTYWNPVIIEKEEIGEKKVLTYFATWGKPIASTQVLHKENPKVPNEEWNKKQGIGHAVTAVGFLEGDPDGERGSLPNAFWVIVHDNWASTPENIAIPWKNINGIVFFGGEPLFELLEYFQHMAEG
jgi:hypothetical protein